MRFRLFFATAMAVVLTMLVLHHARATVTTTATSVTCTASGGALVCATPFPFLESSNLVVTLDGTLQTIGTHYTVACAGCTSGGSVTMVSNPTAGQSLVVRRVMPYTQPFNARSQGTFRPASYEATFDRLEMQIQQLAAIADAGVGPQGPAGPYSEPGVPVAVNLSGVSAATGSADTLALSDHVHPISGILPITNGGTGSATKNFVDLTTVQSAGGAKTFTSLLTGSAGLVCTGSAAVSGVTATGGTSSAAGGTFTGGAPNGVGVVSGGTGTGNGGSFTGGATGYGVLGTGGSGGGIGVYGLGTAALSGVVGEGGPSSGAGGYFLGGAPNGSGAYGVGTGTGSGLVAIGGATNGFGVEGTGDGTGAGGSFTGGDSDGTGVIGTGGATNGSGVVGIGIANGIGVLGKISGYNEPASAPTTTGVAGYGTPGVYGYGSSTATYALYAQGYQPTTDAVAAAGGAGLYAIGGDGNGLPDTSNRAGGIGGEFQGGAGYGSGSSGVGVKATGGDAASGVLGVGGTGVAGGTPGGQFTANAGSATPSSGAIKLTPAAAAPTFPTEGEAWVKTSTHLGVKVGSASYYPAPLKVGTCVLGTSCATVTMPVAGMFCVCSDTTAANACKGVVAATTATFTGTGTDTLAYICALAQ